MRRTDEEVYQILVSEKRKRRDTTIAVLAFLLILCMLVTAFVLVIYSKNGNAPEHITIYTNGGSIENTNINTTNSATHGDVSVSDSAPAIGGFACAILITIGGFIWLLYYIRKSK